MRTRAPLDDGATTEGSHEMTIDLEAINAERERIKADYLRDPRRPQF